MYILFAREHAIITALATKNTNRVSNNSGKLISSRFSGGIPGHYYSFKTVSK
jgi:hypothetical protein